MSYRTLYYALVIPGIGTPFNLLEPYAFYEGDNTLGGGVTSYSNVQALLSTPETLGTKIQPLTGTVDSGSITFEMIAPGAGVEVSNVPAAPNLDITALFTRRILEFDGILAADIGPSDTTIELFSFSGSLFVEDDILYLENETIQLGVFLSVVDNVQTFTGCSRGVFGSRAREHFTQTTVGNPLNPYAGYDNRVYFNPKIVGREVFVLEHDGTTLNTVFRGVLTNVEMSRDMSALKVHVQDLYSLFATRTFNKNPYGPELKDGTIDVQVIIGDIDETSFQIETTSSTFTTAFGPGPRPNGSAPNFYSYCLLQVKDSLVPAIWFVDSSLDQFKVAKYYAYADETLTRLRYPPIAVLPLTPRPISKNLVGSPAFEEEGSFDESVFEVLALGQIIEDQSDTNYASINPVSATDPYHPLTAWLAMICSVGRRSSATTYGATNGTYDLWRYQWGMGVPQDLVDVAGVEALIAATSDQVIQNAVVFGWGGDTWTAKDFREKLLIPFFFYVHLTSDCKLTVSQLSVVLPSGATIISAAKVEKLSEMQNFNLDDWVQTIEAKYKLPWTEEGHIIAQDLGQGVTIWDPEPRDPEFNFDVTAFRQDSFNDVIQQTQTLGPRSTAVYTMLNWFKQPIPTYKFVLTQPSFVPFAGQKIGLEVAFDEYTGVGVYLDKDGSRLGGGVGETIYGIITEVAHKPRSDVYEIDLWAINDILIDTPKEIPPTFDITLIPAPGFVDVARYPSAYFGVDMLPFLQGLLTAGTAELARWDQKLGNVAWNGVDQYATFVSVVVSSPTELRLQFSSNPLALSVEEFLRLMPRTTINGGKQNAVYAYMASENGVFTGNDVGDIYVL